MKRKITWLCIFILVINNIFGFGRVSAVAGEAEGIQEIVADGEDAQNDQHGQHEEENTGDASGSKEDQTAPGESAEDKAAASDAGDTAAEKDTADQGAESNAGEQKGGDVSDNSPEPPQGENVSSASGNVVSDGSVSRDDVIKMTVEVTEDQDSIKNGPIPVKKVDEEIISVTFPSFGEDDDLYDFILDPFGMINQTEAARYGGGNFQKDATLFFKNQPDPEAEPVYSNTSDFRSIVNKSNVPVEVTVILNFSNEGRIRVSDDPDFKDLDAAAVAFGIVDENGESVSMNLDGEARFVRRLEAAPEDTYVYIYDEEEGRYRLKTNFEDMEFDEFSFGIWGAANPNGDWENITEIPGLEIMWSVEPILDEKSGEEAAETPSEEAEKTEEASAEEENASTPSDNKEEKQDTPEEGVESASDNGEGTGNASEEAVVSADAAEVNADTEAGMDMAAVPEAGADVAADPENAVDMEAGTDTVEEIDDSQKNEKIPELSEAKIDNVEDIPAESAVKKDVTDEEEGPDRIGKGRLEGTLNKDIFSARLPVQTEGKFRFIMDPEMLITRTKAAAYPGQKMEMDQTLYFHNTSVGSKYDYSSKSDPITIVNNGTVPVRISVSASLTGTDIITMSASSNFADSPNSHLYFAFTDAQGNIVSTSNISENSLAAEVILEGVSSNEYELRWSAEEEKYEYVLPEDIDPTLVPRFSFYLQGASNTRADWRQIVKNPPRIQVVWKVEPLDPYVELAETDGKTLIPENEGERLSENDAGEEQAVSVDEAPVEEYDE